MRLLNNSSHPFLSALTAALLSASLVACGGSGASENEDDLKTADAGVEGETPDASGPEETPDAGGPCTPGAESLVCANATTVSMCTDDVDFDGESDGDPRTVQITCKDFFRGAGEASCETFDSTTTEALCTMDDGGPCGVILVTGQFTSARCTTDDAVCLLNLEVENYVCTANTGLGCTPGDDFVPYCSDDLLVWRCAQDGDGTGQPHVDDCGALGGGTCDATQNACVGITEGGRCNATEWFCGSGLKCESKVCVPE